SRVPTVELSEEDVAKTLKIDLQATLALDRAKQQTHAATNSLLAAERAEAVDPQFLELFIEEAKEEITSIQRGFPLWDQNPMDLEPLASLRRSFHTLKGSGRMVGARRIASPRPPRCCRTARPWIRSCTRSTARKRRAIWPKSAIICANARASPLRTICPSRCIAPSTL